jgi:hypothetical protein
VYERIKGRRGGPHYDEWFPSVDDRQALAVTKGSSVTSHKSFVTKCNRIMLRLI